VEESLKQSPDLLEENNTPTPEPAPQSDELTDLVVSLVELMQADPTLAAKMADVIEQHYVGGDAMPVPDSTPMPQEAPAPAPQMQAPQAQAEAQLPPEVLQRLATLEQALDQIQRPLADYQLDKELAQMRQAYGKYRQHYGDVLPENFDELERPVLEKYQALLEGKLPPHELALKVALDEVLHGGDTLLKDRLLASVAKQAPQVPRVEGAGGSAAAPAAEERPTPRTTAERMAALKELYKALQQNPGQ